MMQEPLVRHLCSLLLLASLIGQGVGQRSQAPRFGMRDFNPVAGNSFLTASIVPSLGGSRRNVRNQPRHTPMIFKNPSFEIDRKHSRREAQGFNPGRVSFNFPSHSIGPGQSGILFPRKPVPKHPSQEENLGVTVPSSAPEVSSDIPSRKSFRTLAKPECAEKEGNDELPCERDSEYDQVMVNKVAELLSKTGLNSVINNDIVSNLINDTSFVREKGIQDGIHTRINEGFVSESPACFAVESIIYPQRAKTQQNDWAFVVNQDMVRQGVRVEKCLRETSPCNLGSDLPPTIKTVCRQKFIYRKLLVLNHNGTDIQSESVLIPSCCVCYVSRSDGILNPRIKNNTQSQSVTQSPVTATPLDTTERIQTEDKPEGDQGNTAPIVFN